jgi:hypothetical protein
VLETALAKRHKAGVGPHTGFQREARDPKTEFLQRLATRNGLGQAFSQVIEFVVHNLSLVAFSVYGESAHGVTAL